MERTFLTDTETGFLARAKGRTDRVILAQTQHDRRIAEGLVAKGMLVHSDTHVDDSGFRLAVPATVAAPAHRWWAIPFSRSLKTTEA